MKLKELMFLVEMPLLDTISVKGNRLVQIYLYLGGTRGGEQEHPPPHIHVVSIDGSANIPIDIETGKPLPKHPIKGNISNKTFKMVRKWLENNRCQGQLRRAWQRAQNAKDPRIGFIPWDASDEQKEEQIQKIKIQQASKKK